MPVRRTNTPDGTPGFNCVPCEVCGETFYRKKTYTRKGVKATNKDTGPFRCAKHRLVDPDTALFDVEEFNP